MLTHFFKSEQTELWFRWASRLAALVLVPVAIGCAAYLKTTLVAHGNIYFVSREEFVPLQKSVAELTSHTNAALSSLLVIRADLNHIQDSLRDLKTDVRDLRSKQ